MLNTENFTAAQKTNLEALVGLGAKALDSVEQLTALNLKTAKAGLEEAAETTLALLSAKDAQALITLQAGLVQPAADKFAAYGRQVYDIVVAAKADVDQFAAEQFAGLQDAVTAAVEAAAKNAPEGTGNSVALLKQAFETATNAFEGIQKATRQAASAAEANYTAVTSAVTPVKTAKAKRA